MKTKQFLDPELATQYAHACQAGGWDVSLIIKRNNFLVTERDHEHEFWNKGEYIERFNAPSAARGVGTKPVIL